MARIRGRDTSPELILRKALASAGIRCRAQASTPICRADLAFVRKRIALFVDGCQWHGCPAHYVRPRSNVEFWANKLSTNVARDRRQTLQLEDAGWHVVRIWEHQIYENLDRIVESIGKKLHRGRRARSASWRVVRVDPLDPSGTTERRVMEDLRITSRRRTVIQQRSTKK
ncbi:MAG: DNA mismatch endonuclease Vsr [Planctomycetes bacterium]|nr:DNA mismatch endonuclease Vsr [Planctomycetota bacterium]